MNLELCDHPGNSADESLEDHLEAFLELRRELVRRGALLPIAAADVTAEIAGMSNRALVDLLWEAHGRRSCLVLRTRLSQKAERQDGRRVRGRGRDRV